VKQRNAREDDVLIRGETEKRGRKVPVESNTNKQKGKEDGELVIPPRAKLQSTDCTTSVPNVPTEASLLKPQTTFLHCKSIESSISPSAPIYFLLFK
jgi:hypothetical protein